MIFFSDIFYFLTELYLLISFFILFLYFNFLQSKAFNSFFIFSLSSLTFFYLLLLSLFFVLADFYINFCLNGTFLFYFMYHFNSFIILLKFFLGALFIFYFIFVINTNFLESIQFNEYSFIFFFYILFSFLFLSVLDLLTFFLLLEFQAICSYTLISIERNSIYSIESSLRYWILNAITSLIILFSILFFYFEFGVLDLLTLSNCFYMLYLDFKLISFFYIHLFLASLLFLFSFFFKIGSFPFHVWNIDVYEFVSTKITLFFLVFPKFLLFILFLKFFYASFDVFLNFFSVVITFSFLLSILFSVCFSIFQDKIKKIFILNSIFSTGFQLFFISLSLLETLQGFFLYVFFYFINLFSFFFLKISVFEFNCFQIKFNFNLLNKLYYSNFFLSIIVLILTFSSLGIPPFSNFFCKIFIFYTSILCKDYSDFLFLFFFSMISAFYHLRFVKSLFFDLCLGRIFFISYPSYILSFFLSFFSFLLCFFFLDILPLFFFTNILIFYFLF